MSGTTGNPYEALKRIFHEPNRLAIMSALCAAGDGMAFGELRDTCGVTDGNLNRHLKVLQDAGAIRVEKHFVGVRPRTTIRLSSKGLRHFNEYLDALDQVLEKAKQALPTESRSAPAPPGKRVRA